MLPFKFVFLVSVGHEQTQCRWSFDLCISGRMKLSYPERLVLVLDQSQDNGVTVTSNKSHWVLYHIHFEPVAHIPVTELVPAAALKYGSR